MAMTLAALGASRDVGSYVEALGNGVLAEWQRHNFAVAAFPAIAETALVRTPPHGAMDSSTLVQWVLESPTLTYQQNFESPFGQPPVTLYWHSHFHIQALFWGTSTTAVHDHSFAGAFAILDGASLQSLYAFEDREEISPTLVLGNIAVRGTEVLHRGAVQPIQVGDDFIHSAFHLDFPSTTLVIRTHGLTSITPRIFEYLRPHVAIDSGSPDQHTTRRIQCLSLLASVQSPRYEPLAIDLLRRTDAETAFILLREAWRRGPGGADSTNRLAAVARERWGNLIDRFTASFDEERRQATVLALRARVTQSDLRLLIGLLLTQTTRRNVLNVIAAEHHTSQPAALAVNWLQELGRLKALPVVIDDVTARVLGAVLEDTSDDPGEILNQLTKTGLAIELDDLLERMRRLAVVPLLKPLFVPR